MRRKLLLIVALWAVTVLLMAVQKPIFLAYYATEAAQASVGEWWLVVWHGLKLDMTVAGYITVLPILMLLLSVWVTIPERVGRALLRGYLMVIAILCGILFGVDLGLYEYWGFRLDSTLLIYLADPKEAMASVDLWSGIRQTLFMAGYAVLLYAAYRPIVKFFDGRRVGRWLPAAGWTVVMLLVAGLDFLAIRGGVGTSVANVSKVCFSPNLFLNHAATNPIFSFLSTIGKQENYAEVYPFYTAEELAANFEEVRGNRPTTAPREELLTTERPNVLLIVLESFGRTIYDADEAGQPIMPRLRQLAGEGVWFENFYANSFRTDRGQMAILSGFPAQTKISLMKLTPKCLALPSVARSLGREGYRTQFVYGGDLNFTNQASYMYATGWQELVWQKDMSFDAPTSKWGYDDRVVGEWLTDYVIRLSASDEPFLVGWLTLSSHEPFEVGDFARFDDPRTNAYAFTDDCVGQVIEQLRESPAWEKLLVILVADHGTPAFRRGSYTPTEVQRIPMLWVGGAVKEPRVIEAYGSQIDLAATLLGQMGVSHEDFAYSKDLLQADTPKFAYYTYNEGFGIVEATGESRWDAASDRTSDGADERQLRMGRTLLQQTYEDIERR